MEFVLPLAASGYRVIAIERDPFALHGDASDLPIDADTPATGLIDRLKSEELQARVWVIEEDFLEVEPLNAACDAVWTSCSWHYSANHRRPLADFVARMQSLVRVDGLFGAEFMMRVEPRRRLTVASGYVLGTKALAPR